MEFDEGRIRVVETGRNRLHRHDEPQITYTDNDIRIYRDDFETVDRRPQIRDMRGYLAGRFNPKTLAGMPDNQVVAIYRRITGPTVLPKTNGPRQLHFAY